MAKSSFFGGTGISAANSTALESSTAAAAASETAAAASATSAASSAASASANVATNAASAAASEVSRQAALVAKTAAETAETNSGNSATASANSATASANSATSSANSANASANSANASANSATASEASKVTSGNSAAASEASKVTSASKAADAETARAAAVVAKDAAAVSATNAANSVSVSLAKSGGAMSGAITTNSTFDGRDVATDGAKLDGIEANATADQTGAQIKSAYQAETNAFTDAQFTKLSGIEASATADQTPVQLLTAIKTVDGAGTGLDADLLDGQEGSYFTGYTDTAVSNLVDSSPAALNTLNELAAALGDDVNFSTTVTNSIATKAALSGAAFTGAITTNSTFDGVDVGTRDAVLTSTTTTANAALPKAGGTMTGPLVVNETTAVTMSAGTTAQRPTGVAGMFRYNTTEDKFEGYSNSWGEIGGGAADLRVNSFTGDGSTVAYSLSSSPDLSNTLVYIDGIYQVKAAYAMSGQTLTFTAAPDNGALIEITAATVAPVQESTDFLINNFTGNNSTTAFSLSSTPTSENQCSVFISGVYQSKANFSVSGSTLTFSTPPPSGSAIEVMCARTVVFGIGTPDDNTVSTVKIQDDAVTSAKVDGTVATVAGTETLTNKTLTAPTINGGTHTAFTSTGIDDNATSTAITIDQNENVGVGSAPDAWASGYSAIDVGSAGSLWATTAGANLTAISDNSFYDGTTYVAKNTGHGSMYFQNLGNHYWRNFASVSGGAVQTGVDKMQLTAAGNLDLIDGNLEVAAGHGIDFSANSHAGGMTSELLDSYETGTFVPTFQSLSGTQPTLTYVSQVGYYTKIGNIVHVSGGLSLNGMVDGTNGTFVIADLPFNIAHICVGSHTGSQLTMTLGAYQLSLYTANRIGFLGAGASGTSWGWHSINSILGPTSALRFSLTYETA